AAGATGLADAAGDAARAARRARRLPLPPDQRRRPLRREGRVPPSPRQQLLSEAEWGARAAARDALAGARDLVRGRRERARGGTPGAGRDQAPPASVQRGADREPDALLHRAGSRRAQRAAVAALSAGTVPLGRPARSVRGARARR